ncbi:MAG: NAD(P)H-hydrate dehydratase [Pseudomonadales bacterium]|jgi:NAD(P)H-hydrate epimerase|nr:NAD(P)H-hydrate dehydratase [Pseudomonadales bacterium]
MQVKKQLPSLNIPNQNSRKGQNGKMLIIGGSTLFHAASQWSFNVASKIVDMVFYSSTPENNQILLETKKTLVDGLVVSREQVMPYASEAEVILIGPGMTREIMVDINVDYRSLENLDEQTWNHDTATIVNFLLAKFPDKKFVLDAGALQMVDLSLLSEHCLLTPHQGEYQQLLEKLNDNNRAQFESTTILKTGPVDTIFQNGEVVQEIEGGNAGMTKGGTGDALSGLVAALYCSNDILTSAIWASSICKKAGDELHEKVGPFFNASDLVEQIPKTLWKTLS